MKKIMLCGLVLLSACSGPGVEPKVFPSLPPELSDCKFFKLTDELGTQFFVARCTNTVTMKREEQKATAMITMEEQKVPVMITIEPPVSAVSATKMISTAASSVQAIPVKPFFTSTAISYSHINDTSLDNGSAVKDLK